MIDIDKIERLLSAGVSHSRDIAALIAEVRRLSGIVEKYIDPSQVLLTGMVPMADGLHIGLEGGACRLFAGAFAEQFRDSKGINYVEMRFNTDDVEIGDLLVTMQRAEGKTPAQCKHEVEAERDALRSALQRIADIENEMVGGDWDEIEAARRIALHALTGSAVDTEKGKQ